MAASKSRCTGVTESTARGDCHIEMQLIAEIATFAFLTCAINAHKSEARSILADVGSVLLNL